MGTPIVEALVRLPNPEAPSAPQEDSSRQPDIPQPDSRHLQRSPTKRQWPIAGEPAGWRQGLRAATTAQTRANTRVQSTDGQTTTRSRITTVQKHDRPQTRVL